MSNILDISEETGDPRLFRAGITVRLTSQDELTIEGSNPLIGVSLGCGLVDREKTMVARVGNFIPLLIHDLMAEAKIQSLNYVSKLFGHQGNFLSVEYVDLLNNGGAHVLVIENSIVVSIQDGVTNAGTIKAAIDLHEVASKLVSVSIDEGEESEPQIEEGPIDLHGGVSFDPDIGTAIRIDPTSGMASASGQLTGGVYLSGRLNGMYPNRDTHPCCLIGLMGGF